MPLPPPAAPARSVQLSDETFIAADRTVVARLVADSCRWARWWPDLRLSLLRDRGVKGCQWGLTGEIGGTAEIYLEPWHDGTVLHLFLRLELTAAERAPVDRLLRERALAWKRTATALKDELEAGRAPGTPARGPHGPQVSGPI